MIQPELRKLLYCTELQRWWGGGISLSFTLHPHILTPWPWSDLMAFQCSSFFSLKMRVMINRLKRVFHMKSLAQSFECSSCLLDVRHQDCFNSEPKGQRARSWLLLILLSETQWYYIKSEKGHSRSISRARTGPLLSAYRITPRYSYSMGNLKAFGIWGRSRDISCLYHAFC